MWLWIVAVLLIILIWGGSLLLSLIPIDISLTLRVLLTVGVLLMAVGVVVFRKLRARARARALEQEILKQSEQQAAMARPDRRGEILELQRQVQQGIQALKQTKVGQRYGSSALYMLPWYAIIGPPGAGKTTALRHSGLVFPFLNPHGGGGVRGVGGTRNCDWWFTNDGILLDTAGRYAVEEDDREEWFAFLGMLRKHRPQKPINGLLVAIAVSDLVEATDEQLQTFAGTLRTRVDEIMTRLDMVLPVYVMFTKADLIGGFVEFWGDLRKSERDQLFGATFPLEGAEQRDAGDAFRDEFERLVSVVHARALRAIGQQRRAEVRAKVLQFPLEFRALGPNLETFLRTLFLRNTFQESPLFRGFYFSSGTQEGRPFDRVIGGMARAFGIRPPQTFEPPTEPKSYFVTDMFRRVVFPDRDIAGRTASELRRQRLIRAGIAAGAIALSLLIVLPALASFGKNKQLISETSELGRTAKAVNFRGEGGARENVAKLTPVLAQVKKLDTWEEEGPPFSLRWGMYEGDTLYPALLDAYVGTLDQGLARPSQELLESRLRALGMMQSVPSSQYAARYNELKLYLMLTNVERLDVEWAGPHLTDAWASALRDPAPKTKAEMRPHVDYYLSLMKRGIIPPWKADSTLVSRGRSVLLRAPQIERLYEILIRDANARVAPIRRETIFYGSVAPFVSSRRDVEVAGAYTAEGWEHVRRYLGNQRSGLSDERWVLGEQEQRAQEEVEKQIDKLRALYFARYKDAWRDFISDLEVEQPKDATKSMEELNALSEPEWPYLRLLRTLHENTTLELEEEEGAAQGLLEQVKDKAQQRVNQKFAVDAGGPSEKKKRKLSPVERAYKSLTSFAVSENENAPTGLSQYQAILAKLVGVMTDLRDSNAAPDTGVLAKEFESAFRSTSELLTTQDGFTRPLLSPLLIRPLSGSWTGVVNDAGAAAGGLWEISVWDKWHTDLEPLYPFSNSPKDVKLEDFTEFFKPEGGALWGFYDQNLAGSLRRVGNRFLPAQRFKSSINFTSEFVSNCLERGAKITNAAFPGKAEAPAVEFEVNLHSVSENVSQVELTIDGVSHMYKNTPEEWLKAQWPAKDAEAHGARARIRGFSGLDEEIIRDGDFGFFRLLDAASKVEPGTAGGRPGGEPTLVATWELPSEAAFFKLDVRAKRKDVELSSSLFDGYQCPRVIATSGG
jgi:type VI secretion system protein ImpL